MIEYMMSLNWLINIVEHGDVPSLLCLLLCLTYIGHQSLLLRPQLRSLGHRIGLVILLVYGIFRSITRTPSSPIEILQILLRAVLAAAFTTTIAWILLPVFAEIGAAVGSRIVRTVQAASRAAAKSRDEYNRRRLAAERQQELTASSREAERGAPERESIQLEKDAQIRLQRAKEESDQLRREEARLRAELFYERHARQLASSFPRERFEQFMARYMGETTPPDMVEQRELLLKETILDSLGTATIPKFASMTDLAAFFEARRLEIGNLPHSEEVRDTYLVQLNKQEDEALRKFLKP